MAAWVKFINKTNHRVIYIMLNGRYIPFPLVSAMPTKYILSPAGSVCIDMLDGQLRPFGSIYITVIPHKNQSIVLF